MESQAALAAILSSLCTCAAILIDVIMSKEVYRRPSQPLLVSCVTNSIMALVLCATLYEKIRIPDVTVVIQAVAAGLILTVVLWVFFLILYSREGDAAEAAAFDAATPIALTAFMIFYFSGAKIFGVVPQLMKRFEMQQIIGVLIGCAALVALHISKKKKKEVRRTFEYTFLLFALMLFNALYMVMIDQAIIGCSWDLQLHHEKHGDFWAYICILPYYSLGLLIGGLTVLFSKVERKGLRRRWPKIRDNFHFILLAELIGTVAYLLRMGAIAYLNVAVVSSISSLFALWVLLFGYALRRWFGFENEQLPTKERMSQSALMIVVVLAAMTLVLDVW